MSFDKQETFNRVVTHLRIQNERCVGLPDENGCAYRDGTGKKCAVGALIHDADYDPDFEGLFCTERVVVIADGDEDSFSGRAIYQNKKLAAAIKNGCGASTADDYKFLYRLQQIHDEIDPILWELNFAVFAVQNGLTFESIAHV